MIYILIYLIMVTGTILYLGREGHWWQALGAGILWPIVWTLYLIAFIQVRTVAKCAWCGKSVASGKHLDKWREHYLEECQEHPLAQRVKTLEKRLEILRKLK